MNEASLPLVYLDSMVFIYSMEGDETTASPARELLDELRKHPGAALTSELSLAEVLAPSGRRGKIPDQLRRDYLDLIVWGRWITLEPVSRAILYETADLRAVAKMKLPDAVHVTTAIRTRCRFFVTSDTGIHTPTEMIKLAPDDAGVARTREALV